MEISKTLKKYKYHLLIIGLLLFGVGWRLIPHPPNFAPVGAIAIASGMIFQSRRAIWLPLAIMVVSDIIIGLYHGFLWTWLAIAIIPVAGFLLQHLPLAWRIPLGAASASLLFFVISNFGVWMASGMYSHTLTGLIDCYVMALPFLRNTMLSNIIFTSLILTAFEYGAILLTGPVETTLKMAVCHNTTDSRQPLYMRHQKGYYISI